MPDASTTSTPEQFYQDYVAAKKIRRQAGLRGGPAFGDHPLIWFDQIFGAGLAPQGVVDCPQPLRVGSTRQGLNVVIVANPKNESDVAVAPGATITLSLMQADGVDGAFEDVGPTICVKCGPEGKTVEPDGLIARFALGDFDKPWLKVRLEFAGSVSGGLVDCALGYAAR